MINLEDKVAIVTGGGGGMGGEIISLLAQVGAKVAVADLKLDAVKATVAELNRGGGEIAATFECDVSKGSDIDRLIEDTVTKFGRLDILVNAAGVLTVTPLDEVGDEEWHRVMDINLKGSFECCRAALAEMKKRRSGKIVNIGSLAGKVGGIHAGISYSTSKAGVHCITKTFASAAAPYGINVNCIAPGPNDTTMLNLFTPEQKQMFLDSIPLQRFGSPKDVANAVLFLVSDLSDYITGETINVNGGIRMD